MTTATHVPAEETTADRRKRVEREFEELWALVDSLEDRVAAENGLPAPDRRPTTLTLIRGGRGDA